MRWLWLEKTQLDKPWAAFPIQVQEPVKALFVAAMNTIVGDGNTTLFWTDNWLHSSSLAVLAPHIFALAPKRRWNRRKVSEALHELQWTHDIWGALSVTALAEFIGTNRGPAGGSAAIVGHPRQASMEILSFWTIFVKIGL